MERLSLYDDKGSARIEIGFDERGSAGIRLFGPDKRTRASLAVDTGTGAPRLELLDDQGNPGIKLEISKEFGPSIVVGAGRQGRILLAVSKEGSPSVGLSDQNGPRIWMSVSDGQPVIQLMGTRGAVRSTWKVAKDGSVAFSLLGRDQRECLLLLTDKDGTPAVRLIDAAHNRSREIKAGQD